MTFRTIGAGLVLALALGWSARGAGAQAREPGCACNVAPLGIGFEARWSGSGGAWSETVVVVRVIPGAAAARAAVQPGDTILRVNGLRATSQLLWSVRRTLRHGEVVHLRLRRHGREREVPVAADRGAAPRAGAPRGRR